MNRRRFFNILGSAVIGTAIALKIPDTMIPQVIIDKTKITYKTLHEAYINCCKGSVEPSLICLNTEDFYDAYDMLAHLPIRYEGGGFKFMNAKVIPNRLFNQPQGEIQVIGGADVYNCSGRFYF